MKIIYEIIDCLFVFMELTSLFFFVFALHCNIPRCKLRCITVVQMVTDWHDAT